MTEKTQRTYPYKAWVLTPSFTPAEVELVSASYIYGGHHDRKGKYHDSKDLFINKTEAVTEGWFRVAKQAANLAKSLETLEKKRAALRKAEQP